MKNGTTLNVTLVAGVEFPAPHLSATAFRRSIRTVIDHQTWEFPDIKPGERIELVVEEGDTFDPPSHSGDGSGKLLPDQALYLQQAIAEMHLFILRTYASAGSEDDLWPGREHLR